MVFSGHEHVYERVKPHEGINFFVLGNSGKLMRNDIASKGDLDSAFDRDRDFMLVEIAGDKLYYQMISRSGQSIDSGSIGR